MAYLNGKQVVIPNLYATLTPRSVLSAPSISISGSTLTITDTNEVDVIFNILVNDAVRGRTSENTFDLSTFEFDYGEYKISVIAMAMGYTDSPESNVVSYVVAPETPTLTAPTIFIDDDDRLWINDESDLAEQFAILVNGEINSYIEARKRPEGAVGGMVTIYSNKYCYIYDDLDYVGYIEGGSYSTFDITSGILNIAYDGMLHTHSETENIVYDYFGMSDIPTVNYVSRFYVKGDGTANVEWGLWE